MTRKDVVAGLDLGSGRVACLIGSPDADSGRMRVLGGTSVGCRGINGGVVTNIQETARAITRAVEDAESCAGGAGAGKPLVTGLYLGMRGGHLQSFNSRGAFNIARSDKTITPEDVTSVVANAKAIPLSPDREIVHVVPQGFSLDRQPGVHDPVGMEANLLEVEVHIVTASTALLNNLSKAVSLAGFEVIDPVYGLLAAGDLMVSPEEKDLGCVLIDLGGQSVSIGVFCEGSIKYSKELSFGADLITRDLAVGLRTSHATAEKLKIGHGVAHPSLLDGDEEIGYIGIDGRSKASIKTRAMMGFVLPRVEELFDLIAKDLKNSSYADMVVSGGAILTGGGSQLRGSIEAARQILEIDVRAGTALPEQILCDEGWLDPTYATALGLLHYSTARHWGEGGHRAIGRKKPVWIRRLTSMLKELF
ncbi:MAG: cell division protein FtsA [Elusimicrobia bacterium]|nr:cell division protein FtsA [Elusimicrobiota bacterium]